MKPLGGGDLPARGGRTRGLFAAFMLLIALVFTTPAIVALNAQRHAFDTTLASSAEKRLALRSLRVANSFLVSLERYQGALDRGGRTVAESKYLSRLTDQLQQLTLSGLPETRRDAIVRLWARLRGDPSPAQLRDLKSATIQLSGAISDSMGLSFDTDGTIVDFNDALAWGFPGIIDKLNCVAVRTARATRAHVLTMPDRLAVTRCLSLVDVDIQFMLNSDLELEASDAALEARIKSRVAPETRLMAKLQEVAYRTLLIPARPRAGAEQIVPMSAAVLRSHARIMDTFMAVIDNRLALREQKATSARALLNYAYIAAALLGIVLVMFLTRIVVARDRNELQRAERRYRESENALARARAERALELSEAQFRAVFDGAPLGIAVSDGDGSVVKTNQALDDLLGSEQLLFTQNDSALSELLSNRRKCVRLERQYLRRDGQKLWGELTLSVVRNRDDRLQFAIGMLQDVTDRKQSELRLEYEATHDALTGLANRAYFMRVLAQLQLEIRQHLRGNCALLYIDADKFKTINDTLGHEAGDHVLRVIAERLRASTRADDFVARLGGDEFVVLLLEVTTLHDTERFVAAMHERMAAPIVYLGQELRISVSIGFAAGINEHGSLEDVLRQADAAMYRAKRHWSSREDRIA